MSQFTIDRTKPTLPANHELLARWDVASIMEGAQDICSCEQDNDSEIWKLTLAGQFVRCTGTEADRFFVVPPSEALDFLDGLADDDVVANLRAAGAFEPPPSHPKP